MLEITSVPVTDPLSELVVAALGVVLISNVGNSGVESGTVEGVYFLAG